ncbi:hypothetical protein Tco_0807371 [Tanacetum coccineum]
MEAIVEQCSVDKKYFDIQLKESLLTHGLLLDKIMSQDIMNIVAISYAVSNSVNMRMYKLDLEHLAPRLLKNMDAHTDYIKHTQTQANTIRGIVEQAKELRPLDNSLDYAFNDVNVRSKSKSAKRNEKKKVWKPTGNMFTEIGYKWKPIERTFTIDGNRCPLTRITPTKVVPRKETIIASVIKMHSRRPKATKSVGSSSKSKTVGSKITNNSKPNQSWVI